MRGGELMPCELRIRDDLSTRDVICLTRSRLVRATPHVGNWTPARLVLPTLGVSVLCVDHTIGLRDKNTNPHLLIRGGEAHAICDHPDRLTTHAFATRRVHGSAHPVGASLSDVHVGAIRSLYPDASVVTHTEHLSANAEITLRVLEEVTRLSSGYAWWRYVTSDGTVRSCRKEELPHAWEVFEPNIFPLTSGKSGWLIHNRAAILMDIVEQSQMGEEPEIYHLSGPDMVRYLGGEMKAISRMYTHVRDRLGLRQETITINLVPFASFRFATRASQGDACARLCTALAGGRSGERVLRDCLEEASDVLAMSEDQRHFSQHDCVATGEEMFAQEIAYDWPMSVCAERLEFLRSLV